MKKTALILLLLSACAKREAPPAEPALSRGAAADGGHLKVEL